MRWMLLAVALLASPVVVPAQEALPEGEPKPDRALVDPDFNVESSRFGLERRVEMFQWRLDDDGYATIWNDALIDSAEFDPAHQNPRRMPVRGEKWWAERVTLDGRRIPLDTVRQLGRWVPMRPGFSRLPANLAASFQPEGNGLGSALNPLEPEVGDVRVTWHEFVLPPLAGKVQLRDGVWHLTPQAAAAPPSVRPAVDIAAATREKAEELRPWLIALAVASLIGLWLLIRALTGGKR